MNRLSSFSVAALSALLAITGAGTAALADGAMSITNATIDQPVIVEAKVGNTVEDAIPAGGQAIKKGESVTFGATNLRYFWHREVNPGSNDGKWTDWVTVDSRNGDQHVSF